MTTSVATTSTLLSIGTTATGSIAHLNLGERPGFAHHGLIVGGVASGKTVLLGHLARHAETRMPLAHAVENVPQPLDELDVPTNGLVLLDNPIAFADEAALHELLDRADAHGTAVVATFLSAHRDHVSDSMQQRLSHGGQIWLHHRQWAPSAPVDVATLDRHGHGYLHADGELVEFRFGLHSAEDTA